MEIRTTGLFKEEFPDFDSVLYVPEDFVDDSYRNDVSPCTDYLLINGYIRIWQDYENEDKREYSCSRYSTGLYLDYDCVDLWEYDTIEEAYEKAKELIAEVEQ